MNPNENDEDTCVTVRLDYGNCILGARSVQAFVGAFTSFDPNDIGQNFLGTVGSPNDYSEFSFPLGAEDQEFYIVMQQVRDLEEPDNGAGCVMSVEVQIGSGTCSTSRPTVAPTIPPTAGPTVTLAPTSSPLALCQSWDSSPLGSSGTTLTERIVGDSFGLPLFPTSCGSDGEGTFPDTYTFGGAVFYYEQVGPFRNPNDSQPSCMRVIVDPGTCQQPGSAGRSLVLVAAYTQFNPFVINQNYLGGFNDPQLIEEFGFVVQADESFYVVAHQIAATFEPDNGTGCVFSVTVEVDEENQARCGPTV